MISMMIMMIEKRLAGCAAGKINVGFKEYLIKAPAITHAI